MNKFLTIKFIYKVYLMYCKINNYCKLLKKEQVINEQNFHKTYI